MSEVTGQDGIGQRTVENLAHRIIAEVAPAELTILPAVSAGFFDDEPTRRRILRVLIGPTPAPPLTAMDAMTVALIAQGMLLILTGVANNLLTEEFHRTRRNAKRFFRGRITIRRLSKRRLTKGRGATVPQVPRAEATAIADEAVKVMTHAGVPADVAERVRVILEYVLIQRS